MNLRGSTFEKQARDMNFKLNSYGQSKHQSNNSHQTHSNALGIKREQYQKDFINHLRNNNITDGKLNSHLTTDNLKNFLNEKTENFTKKSAENYISGVKSMVEGLQEKNIYIPDNKQAFEEARDEAREKPEPILGTGKSFENPKEVISELYEKNYSSGLLGEVQYTLGLRESEARELITNPDKYIKGEKVEGLIGKGNHMYQNKTIPIELIQKINTSLKLPGHSTYHGHIKNIDNSKSSHSFRYSFAAKLNDQNYSAKEISEALNHHRESITHDYLNKG